MESNEIPENIPLNGFRCNECGHASSVPFEYCPRCHSGSISEEEMPETGKISSFTIQYVPARDFIDEAPYAYAIVSLDNGISISGWIRKSDENSGIGTGSRVRIAGRKGRSVIFEVY